MMDSETTKKALEIALPFLDKLVSPPIEELGLLLQDKVRYWRFNRQVEMLEKAQRTIEKHNIKIKEVSLKVLVPLLEGASLEEDPDLQDMWANLLVSYADSRHSLYSSVFPYILSQLSRPEALCLQRNLNNTGSLFKSEYVDNRSKAVSNAELSNLVRLGLIREAFKTWNGVSAAEIQRSHQSLVDEDFDGSVFHITALGLEFIKACMK